jgi:hypothetical protein
MGLNTIASQFGNDNGRAFGAAIGMGLQTGVSGNGPGWPRRVEASTNSMLVTRRDSAALIR